MVSLCAIGGCDTARCTFRVRLRAYACGTGWLWCLSQRIFRLAFVIVVFGYLRFVAVLTQPLHEGDTLVGDKRTGVAAAHVAGAVGGELYTQAGDLVAAYVLFVLYAVSGGDGGVAEPAETLNVDGAALLHKVRHDVWQGAEHGVGVGWRHGRFTRDAVCQLLRFHRLAHVANSCVSTGLPTVTLRGYHRSLMAC